MIIVLLESEITADDIAVETAVINGRPFVSSRGYLYLHAFGNGCENQAACTRLTAHVERAEFGSYNGCLCGNGRSRRNVIHHWRNSLFFSTIDE